MGMRALIAGIGYRNLSDHSAGGLAVDILSQRTWPANVVVEDLSYGPIAVVQRLQDESVDAPFDRIITVSAVPRGGRLPGTITAYRWDGVLPPPAAVQAAVTEAVTGVISMDNTLVVCRQFGALPNETIVVEIEPLLEQSGESLSEAVQSALEDLCTVVTRLASDEGAAAALPVAPLGGTPTAVEKRS